jgi:hypothetical protein
MMRSTVSAGLFWLILFFATNRVIGMRSPTVPVAMRSAYAEFSAVPRMRRGSGIWRSKWSTSASSTRRFWSASSSCGVP